jgi:ribosomal protein L30E
MRNLNVKLNVNLLTICIKAGKVSFGFDAVKEAALAGRAALIVTSSDASAKTVKEIKYYASKATVPVVSGQHTADDMIAVFGRRIAVLSVNDAGFAKKINSIN